MAKHGAIAMVLGALAFGGCTINEDGGSGSNDGDYEDGTLLRFRLTKSWQGGTANDCGVADSWTWRYFREAALVPDGPDPRPNPMTLVYDAATHRYTAWQSTYAPQGTRADDVRIYLGGSFSYTTWWVDGRDFECISAWDGEIDLVVE